MPVQFNPDTNEAFFLDDGGKWQPSKAAKTADNVLVVYDGKSWVKAELPKRSLGQMVDDVGRVAASGSTLGWSDEISAFANTLMGAHGSDKPMQQSFDENLAAERKRNAEIPDAIRIPGETVGAVATQLALTPLSRALGAATGASKLPPIVKATGAGATTGMILGAGEADGDLMSRVEGGGKGLVTGGAIGAGTHAANQALTSIAQAVKGVLRPDAGVAADLGRAMRRDNMTPDDIQSAVKSMEQERPGQVTLADVGGENMRGLVERVAQTPGGGRTAAIPALTDRQVAQRGRLANDLTDLTGTRKTAVQAMEDTMAERKSAADPLYEQAFNFNARNYPELVSAWERETSTGWGQSILNSPELKKTLQSEYGIKDVKDAPLMVLVDAWKKAGDDIVGEATRKGSNNVARVVGDVQDRVISVADRLNPAYADARNAWAGPTKYMEAIEEGRGILKQNVGSDEMRASFSNMTEAQQEAYRIGAISAIRAKMGSNTAALADYTKTLRSPEMREKIEALMPDADAAARWNKRLDFETQLSEMSGQAIKGSATYRRLAEREDADNLAGDLVMEMMSGAPTASIWKQAISYIPGKVKDTARSEIDRRLADILTNPGRTGDLVDILNRSISAGKPASPRTSSVIATGINENVPPISFGGNSGGN